MREANFNTETTNSLKAGRAWAFKIPDSPTSWTMRRTRFTPEKPCDIIFCFGGRFGAIESKQMKKFQAFGLRHLRENQIRNLDRVTATGGRAFVFLNVRVRGKRGAVVKGKWTGANYENRLIIFDWKVWKPLFEILPLSGKEVQSLAFIRGKKGLFDLSSFLGAVVSGKPYGVNY